MTLRTGLRRLAFGSVVSATAEAINRALPLVTMSLAQARLGTVAFGRSLFAVSFVDCSSPFIEAGTTSFGQARIGATEDPVARGEVLGDVLVIRCLNLLLALGVLAAVTMLRYQEYLPLILTASFMLPSSALDMSYYHIGTQRVWILSTLAVLSKVALLGLVLLTVRSPADGGIFAAALVGGNSLISFGSAALAVRRVRPRLPSWQRLGRIYGQILPFAVAIVLFYGVDKFDFLLVGARADATDVGLYGGANRLFTSIQALIGPLVLAAGAEMLSAADPAALRRYSQIGLGFVSVVIFPIAVGAWFVGGQLLSLVFDPGFAAASRVFAALCTGAAPFTFLVVYGTYFLQPRGQNRRFCVALAGGLAAGVALAFALWPLCGILGIAASAAAAKLVAAVIAYFAVDPELRATPTETYWLRNLLAALIMGGALALLPRKGLVPQIATGAVVYGLAVLALNRRLLARLRRR